MKKTLYLHIGHFKTGTTALQIFLYRNPQFLAEHGIEYAPMPLHNAKHSALAFSIYQQIGIEKLMHGYASTVPAEEIWEEFFEKVRASDHPTVIASSEEFMRVGEFPEAAEILQDVAGLGWDIDIKIVAYLRSPQAHLRSWYNQLVKMGAKIPDYNRTLCNEIESIHSDYAKALRPWIEVFGPENIHLRHYDDARKSTNYLFDDFLSIFGLTLPPNAKMLGGDPNPRLDDRAVDLVRLVQNSDYSRKTVEAVRQQVAGFISQQDSLGPDHHETFDRIRQQAREGLDAIEKLPLCAIDVDRLRAGLPEPEDREKIAQTMLIGFVLSELIALRQRVNHNLPDMTDRLTELNERIAALDIPDAPPAGEA
jgi:hypothetical protein